MIHLDELMRIHDYLEAKKYSSMAEAEQICDTHKGFAWIKDSQDICLKVNKECSSYLGFTSPDEIKGLTNVWANHLTLGHTDKDFKLADKCVLRGGQYTKKVEFVITKGQLPLFLLVSKICILSDEHKPVAVLGISTLLPYEILPELKGRATFAPSLSFITGMIPSVLTEAELHVHILHDHFNMKTEDIADMRTTTGKTICNQISSIRAKVGKVKPHQDCLPMAVLLSATDEPFQLK